MMTVIQLKYVLAVEKCLNFSKAAETLYISQPALSAQIKALETELKLTLFVRSPQGVRLTEEGKNFCREAALLVSAWDDFEKKFGTDQKGGIVQVRVGVGFRALSTGVFDEVVNFYDNQENTEVFFTFMEIDGNSLEYLQQGKIDLAIDRLPPSPIRQTIDLNYFTLVELMRERQCAVVSPNSPLINRAAVQFNDLRGCRLITGLKGSSDDLAMQKVGQDHDLLAENIYRTNSLNVMMELIRKGEGITIGPESLSSYFSVATVPIVPEKYVPLYLMCLKQRANTPTFGALRDYLSSLYVNRSEL
jgi:DNA-binding transcriptional LysR family regulator